tara:strand:+ start:1597 stop:2397 length:801 start_codon:yes stop_codon:yes gene_type:complete
MRKIDKKNNRLVYFINKATNDYWDSHWGDFTVDKIKEENINNNFCVKHTKNYLPTGSKILEGGCGKANNVYALQEYGYDCIGVDFAEKTVARINELVPELNVVKGDVFKLDIKDNSLDGYWSLGVIEHFWDGYDGIATEMSRTIKKDGYLFLTVPTMSNLRKVKAKLGFFPKLHDKEDLESFYQFALDPNSITKNFEKLGFQLENKFFFDASKGIRDEISILRPVFNLLKSGKIPKSWFILNIIEKLFASQTGHCVCLILKNKKEK